MSLDINFRSEASSNITSAPKHVSVRKKSQDSLLMRIAKFAVLAFALFNEPASAYSVCREASAPPACKAICEKNGLHSKGAFSPYNKQVDRTYSSESITNDYTSSAPQLFDEYGNYKGRWSTNTYNSDSITNRYSKYYIPPFTPLEDYNYCVCTKEK